MENNNEAFRDQEDPRSKEMNEPQNQGQEQNHASEEEGTAGVDIISEGLEEKHHQAHGNRRYRMFSNDAAARNNPRTNTDTPFNT